MDTRPASSTLVVNGSSHAAVSGDLSGMSVLVTDEHYKHTLGLVRHLGRQGVRVGVLAGSNSSLACSTRYCETQFPLETQNMDSFVASAYQAVTQNHFDLLIPVSYPRTLALARHKSEFLPHVSLELSNAEQIVRAANKACVAKLAAGIGVPVPQSFVPESLDDVRRLSAELRYPVVVKPQQESPGRSVHYAQDAAELHRLCFPFFQPDHVTTDSPLLQEFIPGYGCGFFATYQKGVCKRVFMHRRVREYPASGGVSTCAQSFHDPKLEAYGRKLLDALSWHGVAMVEFRHDSRDQQFKLIEINPKLWGSLDLALAAGADFPGDLCRMARGEDLPFTDTYDHALRFHWPLSISGELYHLKSRPQSIVDVTLDLLNPRVKSNIWASDLGPTVHEVTSLGRYLLWPKSRKG